MRKHQEIDMYCRGLFFRTFEGGKNIGRGKDIIAIESFRTYFINAST